MNFKYQNGVNFTEVSPKVATINNSSRGNDSYEAETIAINLISNKFAVASQRSTRGD